MPIRIRRVRRLYEETEQPQQAAAQPQQQQAPAQPQQQNQQQAQSQQPVDMNVAVQNINKFIGTLYQNIQTTVKDNLEKTCPEIVQIFKDQNSPLKEQAKQVNDAYVAMNKLQVNPDDSKTTADAVTAFATLVSSLTAFNNAATQANNQNANNAPQQQQPVQQQVQQPQPQQQATQPVQQQQAQPQQQTQQPQQEQGNVNASYDTDNFGSLLVESIQRANIERAYWRNI